MITPSTLTTSPIHFSLNGWENVRFELMGVKGLKDTELGRELRLVLHCALTSIACR